MGGVILEHVDHVVEVDEGVIDGNNVHLARSKGSPGNQASNTAKSIHSDLHHRVSGTRLALHKKKQLSLEQGGARAEEFLLKEGFLKVFLCISLYVRGFFFKKNFIQMLCFATNTVLEN